MQSRNEFFAVGCSFYLQKDDTDRRSHKFKLCRVGITPILYLSYCFSGEKQERKGESMIDKGLVWIHFLSAKKNV